MSRPLQIPKPQTTLHLYRHLLREASYLPPLARPTVDKQIQDRFLRNRNDEDGKSPQRIRQAHHELRILRAANLGDMSRMRRVLLRAFGRVGRRRRELMNNLLHRQVPANTQELEKYVAEASAIAEQDRKLDWLDAWDVDKLRAFARSQIQAGLVNSPRAEISAHQTSPDKIIPAENAWGRPLPVRLARTKLRNLWKAVADKCMPPLPKEEWEALGDIANDVVLTRYLPPARRPVARSISERPQQEARKWDWQSYAVKPVVAVDRSARRRSKLLTGAVDDDTPTGDPEPINCHKYTPRTWRRMLAGIWQLSPTMEKKPGGQGWNITWGKLDFRPAPAATAGSMEFFRDFPEMEATKRQGKKRRP